MTYLDDLVYNRMLYADLGGISESLKGFYHSDFYKPLSDAINASVAPAIGSVVAFAIPYARRLGLIDGGDEDWKRIVGVARDLGFDISGKLSWSTPEISDERYQALLRDPGPPLKSGTIFLALEDVVTARGQHHDEMTKILDGVTGKLDIMAEETFKFGRALRAIAFSGDARSIYESDLGAHLIAVSLVVRSFIIASSMITSSVSASMALKSEREHLTKMMRLIEETLTPEEAP